MRVKVKDPLSTIDYLFDLSDYLETNETITQASVITNLTLESYSASYTGVTAWVSGGELNGVYDLGCTFTTSGGRIDNRKIYVSIKDL